MKKTISYSLILFVIVLLCNIIFVHNENNKNRDQQIKDLNEELHKEKEKISLLTKELEDLDKETERKQIAFRLKKSNKKEEKKILKVEKEDKVDKVDKENDLPDYKIENIGNSDVEKIKKTFKAENILCEKKTGIFNYVNKIKKEERVLEVLPVRAELTKSSLSVFLDDKENSIRDSIRLEDIEIVVKGYGEKNPCVVMAASKDYTTNPLTKRINFCFENEKELLEWVKAIKDIKRCFLTFENIDSKKMISDYMVLKFLQEKQYELGVQPVSEGPVVNEKLKELYYTNNMEKINETNNAQEKLINKILDDLVEQSLQEQAKKESRTRLSSQNTDNSNITKKASIQGTAKQLYEFEAVPKRATEKNEEKNTPQNTNETLINKLKEGNDRIMVNICVNKNPVSKISDNDFRVKICEIIDTEKQVMHNKQGCPAHNKTSFCNSCCDHISNKNQKKTKSCLDECLK